MEQGSRPVLSSPGQSGGGEGVLFPERSPDAGSSSCGNPVPSAVPCLPAVGVASGQRTARPPSREEHFYRQAPLAPGPVSSPGGCALCSASGLTAHPSEAHTSVSSFFIETATEDSSFLRLFYLQVCCQMFADGHRGLPGAGWHRGV